MKYFFIILLLLISFSVFAQDTNWDIDSFFDYTEDLEIEMDAEPDSITVLDTIRQRGIGFSASFEFLAGLAPAWYQLVWDPEYTGSIYLDRYLRMTSSFSMDFQISRSFRVFSSLSFQIPHFSIGLGDFYFDYIMFNRLFIRGGKYSHSWGISPNFGFTNLLARVPASGYAGESYILKADLPIGKGGIQILTLTRALGISSMPKKEDFGFGGKYNLALKFADFDLGVFYQENMPVRSFLSVKTTVFNTELYTEGLLAIKTETSPTSGAVNLGFARDFYDNKFGINGEIFYNAERDTYHYRPETEIQEEGTNPFIEDISMVFNFAFKPSLYGSPRFYLGVGYNPAQKSAAITPAFRMNPLSHIEVSIAAPIALGSKDGYFYQNTTLRGANGAPLPFALIFLVSLSGSLHTHTTF